jgi:hypothetical protein
MPATLRPSADGTPPLGNLIRGADATLYGAAGSPGPHKCGFIFAVTL